MAISYYECHITLEGNPDTIRPFVEREKWKFSAIDGDIALGDGLKCYATRHFHRKLPPEEVIEILNKVADRLEEAYLTVIRRKVELVIYDDRSSKVGTCDGACVECHIDDYV